MRCYDEIAALRNGKVCERGTFTELMEKHGYFYALHTLGGAV